MLVVDEHKAHVQDIDAAAMGLLSAGVSYPPHQSQSGGRPTSYYMDSIAHDPKQTKRHHGPDAVDQHIVQGIDADALKMSCAAVSYHPHLSHLEGPPMSDDIHGIARRPSLSNKRYLLDDTDGSPTKRRSLNAQTPTKRRFFAAQTAAQCDTRMYNSHLYICIYRALLPYIVFY